MLGYETKSDILGIVAGIFTFHCTINSQSSDQ